MEPSLAPPLLAIYFTQSVYMIKHKRFYYSIFLSILFILVPALLQSCHGVKPSGGKSGKKLFESFYVGDQGTQYFIKTLDFGKEKNSKLKADFTFRYKNEIKDSAIVNFSILSSSLVKNPDSLFINNGISEVAFKNIELLFVEKAKAGYLTRISTKASLHDINEIFKGQQWLITLHAPDKVINYQTPEKTKKSLAKLNEVIFTLLRL